MIKSIAALLVCLCLTTSLPASVILNIIDLNPAKEYVVPLNHTFASRGINYKAVSFPGRNFAPGVNVTEFLKSEASMLRMYDSSGVQVELPPNVDSLSLNFGDGCWSCGPTGIIVNGVSSIVDSYDKLRYHDGMTLGGVAVSITPGQTLTLTGPIQTFAIGGSGLTMSDLSIHVGDSTHAVPEPTTMISAMAATFFASLLQRRRRNIRFTDR